MKKIITAIGDPTLNNKLNEKNNINVINTDIQYQDGIFEVMENSEDVEYIILNESLPGDLTVEELVEKIKNINIKTKIIVILEEDDKDLEKRLINCGVYKIIYNNKIKIDEIIQIINDEENMEKYNEEIRKEINELKKYIMDNKTNNLENCEIVNKPKENTMAKIKDNSKKKNNIIEFRKDIEDKILNNKIWDKYNFGNKIIERREKFNFEKNILLKNDGKSKVVSILGNNGSGKSIFSVMLALSLKKYSRKILIIDFDILNNSLHTILGVRKYSDEIQKIMEKSNYNSEDIKIENLIININKKLDLISGINLIFDCQSKVSEEKLKKLMSKLLVHYDAIIIDTTSDCFFEYTKEIMKLSNECIFLTEANLLEISKSKRFLEMYYNNWGIEKEKIKIVFNKVNRNSIDMSLLKKIYLDYAILGSIKLKNNYESIIEKNPIKFNIKSSMLKSMDLIHNN